MVVVENAWRKLVFDVDLWGHNGPVMVGTVYGHRVALGRRDDHSTPPGSPPPFLQPPSSPPTTPYSKTALKSTTGLWNAWTWNETAPHKRPANYTGKSSMGSGIFCWLLNSQLPSVVPGIQIVEAWICILANYKVGIEKNFLDTKLLEGLCIEHKVLCVELCTLFNAIGDPHHKLHHMIVKTHLRDL